MSWIRGCGVVAVMVRLVLGWGLLSTLSAVETADAAGLVLPSQIELPRLVDIVGEVVGTSIHYDPQKVSGTVRVDLRQRLQGPEVWAVFNQILLAHGFTTVVTGTPAIYHVVPVAEAETMGILFASPEAAAAIKPAPGYLSIVQPLKNAAPAAVIQALPPVLGSKAQVRALGKETRVVIISGDRERVLSGVVLLQALDRAGNAVGYRMYEPRFAPSAKLQQALMAAHAATAKVGGNATDLDVQVMPDGQRLLLVGSVESLGDRLRLLEELDRAEPTQVRTYRPERFRLDDVAQLLEQLLGPSATDGRARLVKDRLTGALVVTATEAEHERIQGIIAGLEKAPGESTQTMQIFPVKYRPADELVALLRELTGAGVSMESGTTSSKAATAGTASKSSEPQANAKVSETKAGDAKAGEAKQGSVSAGPSGGSGSAAGATFTVDGHTNTIIVLGTPKFIDGVDKLIKRLDRRQPQVQVETTMVILSDDDSQSLGVEWARLANRGSSNIGVSQDFGLSSAGASAVDRTPNAGAGGTATIMSPGRYSGLIHAMVKVTHGRNMVVSRSVIDNNEEGVINSVLQEPVANVSSNTNLATTSFGGTSDAGTQIKIKPLIGAGDMLQLNYSVSQSAFTGESTKTSNGGVIPPPKRSDSLSGVVSIPDSHVVALGGLTNDSTTDGYTGVPWLSSIPLLGRLFRDSSTSTTKSRFYLFIRADIMRSSTFEDLRYRTIKPWEEAVPGQALRPKVEPRFME